MENILEPNNHFDFSKLSLAQPIGINGGAYFTKFLYNTQPFYIETPKCLTKQGFIKHGKKIYTELMFDNSDSHFIHWIENLETTCHKLIYENSESWFKDKLELNDIESAFTASLKTYRSGKYYLLRVYGKINNFTRQFWSNDELITKPDELIFINDGKNSDLEFIFPKISAGDLMIQYYNWCIRTCPDRNIPFSIGPDTFRILTRWGYV